MKYIDNGSGDPREDVLFPWLRDALTANVVGIRWQSGYFEASVLGVFMPVLEQLANEDLDAIVLIGSNDGETQSSAVHQLVDALGVPRPKAFLGVVSYANGFYHPKTIHICYRSGREVAYVGSANMTSRGINGLNIEAGIVFDSDEGDPLDVLNHIKQAVYGWFISCPDGLFEVDSHDDVNRLERRGILTTERARRPKRGEGSGPSRDPLKRRSPSYALPPMPGYVREKAADIEDIPLEESEFDETVLIAELAGPGRWGQAAFPEWFIHNFFQVLPDTGDVLHLLPVTQSDGVGEEEKASCGFKEGSRNWYYELKLATKKGEYPKQAPKPIGVFHRIAYQTCRYTILMPDDESYQHVADCLKVNRYLLDRPRNQLPRTIVPVQVLRDAWLGNWFFDV